MGSETISKTIMDGLRQVKQGAFEEIAEENESNSESADSPRPARATESSASRVLVVKRGREVDAPSSFSTEARTSHDKASQEKYPYLLHLDSKSHLKRDDQPTVEKAKPKAQAKPNQKTTPRASRLGLDFLKYCRSDQQMFQRAIESPIDRLRGVANRSVHALSSLNRSQLCAKHPSKKAKDKKDVVPASEHN